MIRIIKLGFRCVSYIVMVVGNGYEGLVKLHTVVLAACCWEGLAPIPPSPLVCFTDAIPMHILLSTTISHGVKGNFTFQQIDRLALLSGSLCTLLELTKDRSVSLACGRGRKTLDMCQFDGEVTHSPVGITECVGVGWLKVEGSFGSIFAYSTP